MVLELDVLKIFLLSAYCFLISFFLNKGRRIHGQLFNLCLHFWKLISSSQPEATFSLERLHSSRTHQFFPNCSSLSIHDYFAQQAINKYLDSQILLAWFFSENTKKKKTHVFSTCHLLLPKFNTVKIYWLFPSKVLQISRPFLQMLSFLYTTFLIRKFTTSYNYSVLYFYFTGILVAD